jgi:hypothetical protein
MLMLPDRTCRLLSAYLDDELSPRQRHAVERLLSGSAEARTLFDRLRRDAERLRGLPRAVLEDDFARRLMQQIEVAAAQPAAAVPEVVRFRLPAWLGVASAAAAVVLAVGLGCFLYFHSPARNNEAPRSLGPFAQIAQPGEEDPPAEEPRPAPAPEPPKKSQPPKSQVEHPRSGTPKSEPVRPRGPVITAPPSPPPEPLRTPEIRVPLYVKFRELDQPARRERLLKEIREGETYSVKLPCRATEAGIERLRLALAGQGVGAVYDADAFGSLKLSLRTDYALYAENVTPADVLEVIARLLGDERRGETRRRTPPPYEQACVSHLDEEEEPLVSQTLGVEPARLDAPLPPKRTGNAPRPQVLRGVEQAGPPEAGQGGTLPMRRAAMIVTYDPSHPREASKLVEQFLDARPERQPGTVQVLWIVHRPGK